MRKKVWRIAGAVLGIVILLGLFGSVLLNHMYSGKASDMNQATRELWKSQSYNYIIETDGEQITLYNYTTDSLLPFGYGHLEQDGTAWLDRIHGNPMLNLLAWKSVPIGRFKNGVLSDDIRYEKHFQRITELPKVRYNSYTKDPVANFEAFWQMFEENYALFEVHPVDWKKTYEVYRPQVTSRTSDKELKRIFREMIEQLEDGHTHLYVGLKDIPSKAEEDPRSTFYSENNKKLKSNIDKAYFPEGLTKVLKGDIRYGLMANQVGYMAVDSFGHTDMKEINSALDQVVQQLGAVDQILVDLRFNGGGYDGFGLELASRFAENPTLAYTKTARNHGDYSSFNPPTLIHIEPAEKRFEATKVVVLTSRYSASAAETTVLAFKELDHVSTMGETTNGIFSDTMFNMLPNQWIVTLSGEKYTDALGTIFEGIGLSPDEEVVLEQQHLKEGKDPVLARAVERLLTSQN